MMPHKRKTKHHSLRIRYISLAVLLGFVIIIGASIGYRATLIDSKKAEEMRNQVSQQSEHLEHVKELKNLSDRSMQLFLLDPQQREHRQAVTKYLDEIISHIDEMQYVDQFGLQDLDERLNQLDENINRFKTVTARLFEIRTDPMRQYPAMRITIQTLMPLRNDIVVSLNEAIAEAKSGLSDSDIAPHIYSDFVELQDMFSRMTFAFRLFMVNRNGGFNSSAISQQLENIDKMYLLIMEMINHLKIHAKNRALDFNGVLAIETLETNLPPWKRDIKAIKEMNDSDSWRLDTLVIQKQIHPLSDEIAATIHSITDTIDDHNDLVVQSHRQIRQMQALLFASLIGIIVIYIITMLISLDKMVFKPIAAVAKALKAEAFGENQQLLIQPRARETRDLVDAFYEMNLQVRNRQMALEYQALHDALTGLPNRSLLLERMDYQLIAAKRDDLPLSLFILDLNRFKEVNDTLGHHIGDQLLIEVGQRFKNCMREIDTIARLGGDEFAILLPNTPRQQSETVAQKLIDVVKEPFRINENQLFIGVSIGIASYPTDGKDRNTLVQHADVAMYNAKLNHLGFTHYNVDEDDHSVDRLSLVQDLRHAIRNDELELYYQPKVDIFKNIPVAAEALLRWNHPELGFIAPDQIIDIAEGVGLIDELTTWVMNRAIAQCAICQNEGHDISMSINLSVKNLLNNQLSDEIKATLIRHDLNSRFITFEITEGSMMDNPENSIKVLNELSEIGVDISVDDFGTGFSSLAYLKQLPVNELKIDKSFVIDMEQNDSDAVIVHSTIELGHNLGLQIVAEGVENQQTCDILKHYGCDLAQGYFISHPLPTNEFMTWLRAHIS